MKTINRVISIVAVICLLCSQAVFAKELDQDAVFDLVSLQIIEPDFDPEAEISRGEFADIIVRFMGMKDGVVQTEEPFEDVNPDDWFSNSVSWIYNMGYMNGTSATTFSPASPVTAEQAVKVLVLVLGYDPFMGNSKEYPDDFMRMAGQLGLLKGYQAGEKFVCGDLIQMLYQALDVELVESVTYPQEKYQIKKGKTFRSIHLNTDDEERLYTVKGVLTANVFTWLNAPNDHLKSNEVEIDDIIYQEGDTNAQAFLGQQVEAYVYQSSGGKRVIRSIRPTNKNTVIKISGGQINSFNFEKIEYYDENDKIQKLSISDSVKYVENGRIVLNPSVKTIQPKENDSVTLISNGDDSTIDIICLDHYVNLKVESVKENTIRLANGYTFDGAKTLIVDLEADEERWCLLDENEKNIEMDKITEGSIISLIVDKDRELYKLYVCDKKVSGIITQKDDKGIYVDDVFYPVADTAAVDPSVGEKVTVSLDYYGYAAAVEFDFVSNYGYLLSVQPDGIFGDSAKVKMLVGSKVQMENQKNEQNLEDENLIPVIKCRNSGVKVFVTAEKIIVDGVKTNASALRPGIYIYEVNSKGEIKKLTSAELYGGGANLKYNAQEKVFGGNSYRVPFAIDKETVVLCVPTNTVLSDDDYFVPLEISNKNSSVTYYAEGFDWDQRNKKVDLVVFHEIMKADSVLDINIDSASIGMVIKNRHCIDEDGNEMYKIDILDKSEEKEYIISDLDKNMIFQTLRPGDLIYFVKNVAGEIDNAEIIYSFADGMESGIRNEGQANERIMGYISDLSYDDIDPVSNKLVTNATIVANNATITLPIYQRNTPPIFIYDSRRKTVTLGSLDQLCPSNKNGDSLFVIRPYGNTIQACVLYQ